MSANIVSGDIVARVSNEFDEHGKVGFVLLTVSQPLAYLTKRAARDLAKALARYADMVRAPRTVVETRDDLRQTRTRDAAPARPRLYPGPTLPKPKVARS